MHRVVFLYQFVQYLGAFLYACKLFILRSEDSNRLAVARLGIGVITPVIIQIPHTYQDCGFLQACLCGVVNSEAVMLQCFRRIARRKVDIAHCAIYLVELVFVLALPCHPAQLLEGGLAAQLGDMYARIELHIGRRGKTYDFLVCFYCLALIAFLLIELSENILEARAIDLAFLVGYGNLNKGNSGMVLLGFEQYIRTDCRIETCVFLTECIDLYLVEHILRLVEPAQFAIGTGYPELAACHHIGVCAVVAADIGKSADRTEEIPLMELSFTETEPRLTHLVVELLLLQP